MKEPREGTLSMKKPLASRGRRGLRSQALCGVFDHKNAFGHVLLNVMRARACVLHKATADPLER